MEDVELVGDFEHLPAAVSDGERSASVWAGPLAQRRSYSMAGQKTSLSGSLF